MILNFWLRLFKRGEILKAIDYWHWLLFEDLPVKQVGDKNLRSSICKVIESNILLVNIVEAWKQDPPKKTTIKRMN